MSTTFWGAQLRAHALIGNDRTVFNFPTGWADDRMMNAYDAVWEVMRKHEALGIKREFEVVLRAIEAADELLIEAMEEARG